MKLVHAKRDKDTFTIMLQGIVGEHTFDGSAIANEINFINEYYTEAKAINLRINSEGGSVINGIRVVSAILNSDIPVNTYNDGYAMSMGAIIWLSAKKENRYMADFAINMLHAPMLLDSEGNMIEPEDEGDKTFLKAVYDQLSQILVNNTGKSKEEINKILAKDSFYNAKESVKEGFVNKENIIKFKQKPNNLGTDISENIKRIAAFYNNSNSNNQNSNTDNMDINWNRITSLFGLLPNSNEDTVAQAVQALQSEKTEVQNKYNAVLEEKKTLENSLKEKETKITGLEKQVSDFKEAEKAAKTEKAKALVDQAIKDGKIKEPKNEEEKNSLVNIAETNPETFNTLIGAVNTEVKAPDVTAQLEDRGKIAAEFGLKPEEMKFWNLWKNNQSALNQIKAKYPTLYNKMEKEAETEV